MYYVRPVAIFVYNQCQNFLSHAPSIKCKYYHELLTGYNNYGRPFVAGNT